jgi:hypothetical protein
MAAALIVDLHERERRNPQRSVDVHSVPQPVFRSRLASLGIHWLDGPLRHAERHMLGLARPPKIKVQQEGPCGVHDQPQSREQGTLEEARAAFSQLSERPTPNAVQWADLGGSTPPGHYPADYWSHRRTITFPFEPVSALRPRPFDHWWPIEASTDLRALSADVPEDVRLYGLPWLLDEMGKRGCQPNGIDL